MADQPLYLGVFLTPESRTHLLSLVPPLYEEVHADHMTIMFRPFQLFIDNVDLGKKVTLRVIAQAHDEKAQAVIVTGVLSANKDPHITISVNREAGGTPKHSNEMLRIAYQEERLMLANMSIDLEGTVDVFPRTTTTAKAQEI